jgi:HAMP domain-containing protein
MSDLAAQILVALIGAVPPTIMAAAAWKRTNRLLKPIEQVNRAVNHRDGGQKRLIEVIDDMAESLGSMSSSINRVEEDLQTHRAWHQKADEIDDTSDQEEF